MANEKNSSADQTTKPASADVSTSHPVPEKAPVKKVSKPTEKETARETIESIVFAFVLAFLFRTFEAEAFVIPTGSMAPTLFGRHKDIDCDQCKYQFQFGASTEIIRDGNIVVNRIQRAICPNCRAVSSQAFEAAPFKGDRILVNKFQYELQDPERFDVVVFKYPEDPKTNFIKRLVGLPGETIRIQNGNVYRVIDGTREEILRKQDPNKQKVLQIPVYDDAYPPLPLIQAGWPERWAAVQQGVDSNPFTIADWTEVADSWDQDPMQRTYSISLEQAQRGDKHWLRYRHFVPRPETWTQLEAGDPITPSPRLIGDFCGYNTYSNSIQTPELKEVYWVGDLTVSGHVQIGEMGPDANFLIELTKAFHWYRCHLNPHTGQARLTRVDSSLDTAEEIELATAKTNFKGPGKYHFRFANVDDRLCLWINDKLVDFGPGAEYESSPIHGQLPQNSDMSPVGIAAQSMQVVVKDLLLERDIYYRGRYSPNSSDYNLLDNVAEWQKAYVNRIQALDKLTYEIPPDRFYVLGDNSPESKDSRFWDDIATVPREAFVGKAFFVYWPHGIPVGVDQGWALQLSHHKRFDNHGNVVSDRSYPLHYVPFYPNFSKMQRIR